jgi:hypothetical protein
MDNENLSKEEIKKRIDEVVERLNSEEYINEIMGILEKLHETNPEYNLFNEEAKYYQNFMFKNRGFLGEVRKKIKLYFKPKEVFKGLEKMEEKLPDGIYFLIFKDMEVGGYRGYRSYYVKDEGSGWSVFKLEDVYDSEIVLFGLYYMVKYKGEIYDVETELPNKNLYTYLYCGRGCMWMPPVVFNAIWPVVRKHIRKIMREVFKMDIGEEIEEESSNQNENIDISQQDGKAIKQFIEKGISDTICWWIKYILWSYSVANILIEKLNFTFAMAFSTRTIRIGLRYITSAKKRAIIFLPKPTVLPKQILIQKPEDVKQIPKGVYPIIRYQSDQISFAITPNTEVVLMVDDRMRKNFLTIDTEPISPFGLEFVIVENNNITRYSILNFKKELREMAKEQFNRPSISGLRPVYWWLEHTYYLPEVLFLRLVNQEKMQREEYVINFMEKFGNSEVWFDWVKTVKNEYDNLSIDENIRVIEWEELHKMHGIWYIKGEFKGNEVPIVDIGNKQRVLKVKLTKAIKKLIDTDNEEIPTFIVVWPDETIGLVVIKR